MTEKHSDGKTAKFEPFPCPGCGYIMDAASHPTEDGVLPGEGDLSVCLKCAFPLTLAGGKWRAITDDELIALPLDAKRTLSFIQRQVREFNRLGRGPKD